MCTMVLVAACMWGGVLGGSGSGTSGGIGRQRQRNKRGYLGGSGSGTSGGTGEAAAAFRAGYLGGSGSSTSGGRDLCGSCATEIESRSFATYVMLFVRVIQYRVYLQRDTPYWTPGYYLPSALGDYPLFTSLGVRRKALGRWCNCLTPSPF